MAKPSDFKVDNEFARGMESTLDRWYKTWMGYFWREKGRDRQLMGIDVNFLYPDATPDSPVYTIDEKTSRFDTGNFVFEVEQDYHRPGWGKTGINDFIVYGVPIDSKLRVWVIQMDGLRKLAYKYPTKRLRFDYTSYVRHPLIALMPLNKLVDKGISAPPVDLEMGDEVLSEVP